MAYFRSTQHGRAPVLLLVICATFALGMAASAYLNYVQDQHAQGDKQTLQGEVTSLKRQLSQAKKASDANGDNASVLGTEVLTLTEFSLNLSVSDPVSDLTYQYQKVNGYQTASFTTKSLAAKYANCKPGALGSLVQRSKSSPPSSVSQLVKTFGNYSYYYVAPSYNCGRDSSTRAEISGDQSYLLGTVLPTLSN